ncbi:MAG: MBL fold metallo-hydrolase [Moorea sp. SIO2B7]|nr:MBL fold metallo-hydrolase [Moorena sp. SIO2B7]
MKRRQLMKYAGVSLLTAIGTTWASGFQTYQAQTGGSVTVKWLGHTCFLFTGSGLRILVNPFRPIGCTAGYRPPTVKADVVLISSQLLDEGDAEKLPGKPKIIYEPGVYRLNNIEFQGIGIDHDREGGRRFGKNVAWRWTQGGVKILHLGGAAAPIEIEQKILMGRPDLALIPVGGGPKAYNPQEAKQAMDALKPKVVIPTHYRTEAADKNQCDIVPLKEFLELTEGIPVSRINHNAIAIRPRDLPKQSPVIRILSHRNVLNASI